MHPTLSQIPFTAQLLQETDRVRLVIYVSTVLVLKGLGSAILNVHMSVLMRWVTYKAAKYLLYSIFISSLVPTEFSSSLLIP